MADEVNQATKCITSKIRLHGSTRSGSIYRSWLALFPKNAAPRPGFRLFGESGAAVPLTPRQTVQQCKRCPGYHATHGCSRAPACLNCGSVQHTLSECTSSLRCRNCGGPHRSDDRKCLARPTRAGPITKEQLEKIRQISQKEFAATARANATRRRAEVAEATEAAAK